MLVPGQTREYSSFTDALGLLARRWWVVAAFLAASVLISVIAMARATEAYEASMIIAPRTTKSNPLAGLQDVPLVSFLGGGGSGAPSNMTRFLVTLTTPQVAERLVADQELMRRVFSGEWDPATGRWRKPGGAMMALRDALAELGGQSAWRPIDADRLARFIEAEVVLEPVRQGAFYQLTFRHPDRQTALDFLRRLVEVADQRLREQDLAATESNIRYLTGQLRGADLAEARVVLADQLSSEYLREMSLLNQQSYAFELLAEPAVSPEPVTPRPFIALVIAIGAGLVGGLAAALLWPPSRPAAA